MLDTNSDNNNSWQKLFNHFKIYRFLYLSPEKKKF